MTEVFELPGQGTSDTVAVSLGERLRGDWRGGVQQLERHTFTIRAWKRSGLFIFEPYAETSVSLETLSHSEPFQHFNLVPLGSKDEVLRVYTTVSFEQVFDFVMKLTDVRIQFPPESSLSRLLDSKARMKLLIRTHQATFQESEVCFYPEQNSGR